MRDDSLSLSDFTSVLFETVMSACRRNMNSRKLEWDGPKKTSIPSMTLVRTHSTVASIRNSLGKGDF